MGYLDEVLKEIRKKNKPKIDPDRYEEIKQKFKDTLIKDDLDWEDIEELAQVIENLSEEEQEGIEELINNDTELEEFLEEHADEIKWPNIFGY